MTGPLFSEEAFTPHAPHVFQNFPLNTILNGLNIGVIPKTIPIATPSTFLIFEPYQNISIFR